MKSQLLGNVFIDCTISPADVAHVTFTVFTGPLSGEHVQFHLLQSLKHTNHPDHSDLHVVAMQISSMPLIPGLVSGVGSYRAFHNGSIQRMMCNE